MLIQARYKNNRSIRFSFGVVLLNCKVAAYVTESLDSIFTYFKRISNESGYFTHSSISETYNCCYFLKDAIVNSYSEQEYQDHFLHYRF
ncbi:hypothetical protein TNCV_2333621 [Trichonephila clavipes]|nr:hypothetical protein TNCV_2333621 [Trichonephila clavipes]